MQLHQNNKKTNLEMYAIIPKNVCNSKWICCKIVSIFLEDSDLVYYNVKVYLSEPSTSIQTWKTWAFGMWATISSIFCIE